MSDNLEPLESVKQITQGVELKIIGKSPKDSYERIMVDQLIEHYRGQEHWHEIVINIRENKYFNFEMFLEGKSWVDKCFVHKASRE